MLACNATQPFSDRKETFPSSYRKESYMSDEKDLPSEDTGMLTDRRQVDNGDLPRKFSSSPTHISNAPSPSQPRTEAAQAPFPQPKRYSPPNITEEREPTVTSPSSQHSPPLTSSSASLVVGRNMPTDTHHMMQLLQHRQHLQEEDLQHRLSQHQQQKQLLQQSRQQYKDLELDLSQDKGNYSDSDSSGQQGLMESEAPYNSSRSREFVSDSLNSDMYWEKRRRNNEAARRSREKRRIQDMAMEGRISCLESDNGRLRRELSVLKKKFNLPEDRNFGGHRMDSDVKDVAPSHGGGVRMSPPFMTSPSQSLHNSPAIASNANSSMARSHPESTPFTSPPPLLAVAGALQMGMAVYPSPGPTLPYFFSETSRKNQEVRGAGIAHGIPSLPTNHHVDLRRSSIYSHIEGLKQEKPSMNEDVRMRERSNSNIVERRPSYQMDMPETAGMRRGSVGNYVQYGRPISPSISACGPQSYPSPHLANRANPGHFLQRPYDSPYPQYNYSQRSPGSSHSSEDNYDEPLQLTVRRDSNISTHSTSSAMGMEDVSSRDSDQGGNNVGEKNLTPGSPPASSFPLKLRHKLPPHDVFSKDVFPNMASSMPSSAAPTSQPSFPTHPFINGLAHLSDIAVGHNNPLSLIKKENFRQRRDSTSRSMSRRNPLDQKYLDPKYLERRRRNNEAARKCRENRKTLTRIREVKSDYLEKENNKLRDELTGLQEEMKQLRELIEKKRLEKGFVDDGMDQKPLTSYSDNEKMESDMYSN